jgi:hypothetical protein
MDNGEFATGSVTEDGPSPKLLSSEVITSGGELTAKERGFVLIREDEGTGFELIELKDTRRSGSDGGPSAWGAFLFAKLTGGAFGSLDSSGPHLDAKGPEQSTAANPLGVLPPEMSPLGVPREQALLQRSEVGRSRLGEAIKGEGLSSGKNVVKATDHGKRGLSMIGDGDVVAVGQLKVGAVPFENVLPAMVFPKQYLRTEEADLKFWEVVALTFQCSDASFVIEDFVAQASFLMGDELASDAVHRKRNREGTEGSRNEIGEAGADAFRASGIHDQLEMIVIGEKVALGGF